MRPIERIVAMNRDNERLETAARTSSDGPSAPSEQDGEPSLEVDYFDHLAAVKENILEGIITCW
jgi:hypothetical protein